MTSPFTPLNSAGNSTFVVSGSNKVLGRVSSGAGAVEELDLDIDGTLTSNSDIKIASQKAVKTYVDTSISSSWNSSSAKNPPIDADEVVYLDSAGSFARVKSTWAQIKAFFKTYFDTLYQVKFSNQIANTVYAGPTTGADAAPAFRSLVTEDLPDTGVVSGTYTNTSLSVDSKGRITSIYSGSSGSASTPVDFKDACDCATTANITLFGEQTIDGFTTSGSRVLVKNQTTGSQNGIYVSSSGAWSRSTDADISAEVTSGMLVFVANGTVNGPGAGSGIWALTTPDPITLDTTNLSFSEISLFSVGTTGKTVSGTSYTHILSDSYKRLNLTNAATKTVTIAPQSSVNSAVNTLIEIFNVGAGAATLVAGSGVTLNSSGGALTVSQYSLAILKKRANPNTWDVVIIGEASTIANDSVTNAKLANMATSTIKGRSTAGTGDPEDLTASQVGTILQGDGLTSAQVGFRNIPQNSQSAAYTTVAADSGKHLLHPAADANARTFTIDSNANVAYPAGTAITFVNETSQVLTIAITSDTLTLAGTTTTGSRSLAQNGIATAIKVTSTKWIISGTGLT